MSKSMLEYLASLQKHGSTPVYIGDATIGRTVYAAGSFRNWRGAMEIALMPMYRTDWARRSNLIRPELLPASYRRSKKTVYMADSINYWYIAGWNDSDGVLWLHSTRVNDSQFLGYNLWPMELNWKESFWTALRLASSEVLARIENQS